MLRKLCTRSVHLQYRGDEFIQVLRALGDLRAWTFGTIDVDEVVENHLDVLSTRNKAELIRIVDTRGNLFSTSNNRDDVLVRLFADLEDTVPDLRAPDFEAVFLPAVSCPPNLMNAELVASLQDRLPVLMPHMVRPREVAHVASGLARCNLKEDVAFAREILGMLLTSFDGCRQQASVEELTSVLKSIALFNKQVVQMDIADEICVPLLEMAIETSHDKLRNQKNIQSHKRVQLLTAAFEAAAHDRNSSFDRQLTFMLNVCVRRGFRRVYPQLLCELAMSVSKVVARSHKRYSGKTSSFQKFQTNYETLLSETASAISSQAYRESTMKVGCFCVLFDATQPFVSVDTMFSIIRCFQDGVGRKDGDRTFDAVVRAVRMVEKKQYSGEVIPALYDQLSRMVLARTHPSNSRPIPLLDAIQIFNTYAPLMFRSKTKNVSGLVKDCNRELKSRIVAALRDLPADTPPGTIVRLLRSLAMSGVRNLSPVENMLAGVRMTIGEARIYLLFAAHHSQNLNPLVCMEALRVSWNTIIDFRRQGKTVYFEDVSNVASVAATVLEADRVSGGGLAVELNELLAETLPEIVEATLSTQWNAKPQVVARLLVALPTLDMCSPAIFLKVLGMYQAHQPRMHSALLAANVATAVSRHLCSPDPVVEQLVSQSLSKLAELMPTSTRIGDYSSAILNLPFASESVARTAFVDTATSVVASRIPELIASREEAHASVLSHLAVCFRLGIPTTTYDALTNFANQPQDIKPHKLPQWMAAVCACVECGKMSHAMPIFDMIDGCCGLSHSDGLALMVHDLCLLFASRVDSQRLSSEEDLEDFLGKARSFVENVCRLLSERRDEVENGSRKWSHHLQLTHGGLAALARAVDLLQCSKSHFDQLEAWKQCISNVVKPASIAE